MTAMREPGGQTLEKAAAVVVTYHPDASVVENLIALRQQMLEVVVVDNGSHLSELNALRRTASRVGFTLIENGANLGIAAALNVGIRHALEGGAAYLFLFDQDSTVTAGFFETMLETFRVRSSHSALGLLVPKYEDRLTHQRMPVKQLADGSLATALTSGTLLPAATWHDMGPFAEDLFIDSVDHEYCLRVRHGGRKIECCPEATLLHSLGHPRQHQLFGVFHFASTNHSPMRRYYQERNKIWIYRQYFGSFPAYCCHEMLRSIVDLVKLLLVEDDRKEKLRFFFRGVRDGLAGRMGAYRA